ncbi:TRAP transporter large permease [Desulfotignum balticum]|uniref:TRAP transporter large permease n=1 Tax=Desulfotignum balticum TaxID=115781 RepID=UPI0004627265|nr:TRAP transporter large permease subunit [Desulfotignum balticum]
MEINDYLVLAMFVSFIALLFSGYPVAYSLAGTSILFTGIGYFSDQYLGTITGIDFNYFGLVVSRIYQTMNNWVLISVPMFIFMGLMLGKSGIAERLMVSAQELFGKVRGGLAITVMFIGILLAASTGIIGASVVMLGLISIPAMLKQGYHKPLAVGTVASAGTLGILIPPSIMLVMMGDQLSVSVGDLFMGAVLPGLLLAFLYVVYLLIYCYLKPDAAPLAPDRRPITWGILFEVIKRIIPPLFLILSVLGSIFTGIATVTEASGVGALMATFLAIFYKKFNFLVLKEVLYSTYNTTAYIFGILIGATCFALVLRGLGGDELVERLLMSLPFGDYGIIVFILFIVFLLGFFLDWIEISLIVLPLVAPVVSGLDIAVNGYGIVNRPEVIWFIIMVAVTLQTSFLTPPVGFALFYLKGITPPEINLSHLYKGVFPFIILQLLVLLAIILFPQLVLWLPAFIYG